MKESSKKTINRRELSQAAQASKQIKQILKKNFPLIKFTVNSSSYAGGDSIRVSYIDAVPINKVEALIEHYQQGSFNGMEDIYEYDNSRNDIPQTKYLFIEREMSDQTKTMIWNKLCDYWIDLKDKENDDPRWCNVHDMNGNVLINREFYKLDLTEVTV